MENEEDLSEVAGRLMGKNVVNILAAIHTSPANKTAWQHKLQRYRFVEDLEGLEYGCYVRWINLEGTPKLTNGGIIIEVKIGDDGVVIVCKNVPGRVFQFSFDASLVFAKLTQQELVMRQAIRCLDKSV